MKEREGNHKLKHMKLKDNKNNRNEHNMKDND